MSEELHKERGRLQASERTIKALRKALRTREAELAAMREEMTTRREHAVKQIEANDRLLIKLAELRELWRKLKVVSEVSRFDKSGREYSYHELSVTMVRKMDKALQEKGE